MITFLLIVRFAKVTTFFASAERQYSKYVTIIANNVLEKKLLGKCIGGQVLTLRAQVLKKNFLCKKLALSFIYTYKQ